MQLAEARRVKWERGRRQYGGPVFVGDPLEEAFEEVVDLINYLEEAAFRGEQVSDMIRTAEEFGVRLQNLYRKARPADLALTAGGGR
jgi:hypothetical protein